jgi:error-prone DNA polymerase
VALPTDLAAWSRLTGFCPGQAPRAQRVIATSACADLEEWGRGMVLIALPPDPLGGAKRFRGDLRRIAGRFAGQCFLGAAPRL